MADERREVEIRFTGRNAVTPTTDDLARGLGQVGKETEKLTAAQRKLLAEYKAVSKQATDVANAHGRVYADLRKVDQLAQNFGGGTAKRKAEEYAGAVAKIGGANKLTAAEQAEVNRHVTTAIAKYQALGQKVPAHLDALARQTKQTNLFSGALGKMASAFAIGSLIDRAVAGIVSFGREAFQTADQIINISDATGLSTTATQRYGFAARQAGSDIQTWSDVILKTGVRLAQGNALTRASVAELGLEYSELQALKPEDQFDRIIRALQGVENPQRRNTLGVNLMTEAYARVAPAVEDYNNLLAKAPVIAEDALRATDRAGDAIARTWDQISNAAVTAIGSIILAIEKLDEHKTVEINYKPTNAGVVNPFAPSGLRTGIQMPSLPKAAGAGSDINLDELAAEAGAAAEAVKTYTERLADARREVARLTPATRAQIDAALKLGMSMSEVAEVYGLSADAQRLYSDGAKSATSATSEAAREAERHQAAVDKINASLSDLSIVQIEQIRALVAMGKAEGDIAVALRTTADHVRMVVAADRERTNVAKAEADMRAAFMKSAAALSASITADEQKRLDAKNRQTVDNLLATRRIETETDELRKTRSLSSYNAAIHQINRWADEQKRGFRGTEAETRKFYDAVDALAKEKLAGISQTWKQYFGGDFAKVLLGALQGGGDVGNAVGGSLGVTIGDRLSRSLGDTLNANDDLVAGPLTKIFGTGVGGAIQSLIPFAGGLLGSMAGKLVNKVVGLFTGGEGAKANDLRDALKQKFGDAAGAGLAAAVAQFGNSAAIRQAYERFMSAGSQKDVQASFDELQAAMDSATDLLDKYGLSLDDLQSPYERVTASQRTLGDEVKRLRELGFGDDQIARGMADSLNDLVRSALDAGEQLPAAFRPLLQQLLESGNMADDVRNRLLGIGDAAVPWRDMESIAKEFNIDLERLGPTFQQSRLIENAEDLASKWRTLVDNGADLDAVMDGMTDQAQKYLDNALKWGLEIPGSMREMLEKMAESGRLTDENGEKLEDLSRVKFGKTVAEQFDPLVEALNDLVSVFRDDLPEAVETLRREAGKTIRIPVETTHTNTGASDPGGGDQNQTQYFTGGIASGRQLAWVAENGRKEIIGDVDFMTRALVGALKTVSVDGGGGATGGAGTGIGAASGGGATMLQPISLNLDRRQLGEVVVELAAEGAAQGRIAQPNRAVRSRVSRG